MMNQMCPWDTGCSFNKAFVYMILDEPAIITKQIFRKVFNKKGGFGHVNVNRYKKWHIIVIND